MPRKKKVKKVLRKRPPMSEETKAKMRKIALENLKKANDGKLQKKERGEKDTRALRSDAGPEGGLARIQRSDIVEFTRDVLGLKFDGYPLFELILRCSEGLPLREGTLKTYVEVPSDGFAVKEVEMTWPEFYALCSMGTKVYNPKIRPQIILARAGRRSSKSMAATVKALYLGTRKSARDYVRSNEPCRIPIVATSQDQAEAIIKDRCQEVILAAKIEWLIGSLTDIHQNAVTNNTIPLIVGTEIQAMPCNSKRVRGEASPVVIFDEYPQFAIDGRKKDKDIRSAATGAQGQFPSSQFMAIGTPAAEQGDFFDLESQAADDPYILALHAPSWTAAPYLYRENPQYYHTQFKTDPDGFDREFRANYAKSVEVMYREEDVLPALCLAGEVPMDKNFRYGAGIDQSGLSGNDRFALSIVYLNPNTDVVGVAAHRTWSVSDLDLIMSDARSMLLRYGLYEVMTDRYAKGYVAAAFQKIGVQCAVSPPAVELHFEFRRLLVARKVELPINSEIKNALLETQCFWTAKTNRPSVAHPRNSKGHGDEAEALVRAVHQATSNNYVQRPDTDYESAEAIRKAEEEYDPMTYGRL